MNMRINPNKVIEDRLAASFGLEQYGYIISQWKTVDVSADEDFQTKFNGYYRVRRNAEWRECYYALFQRGKSEKLSFADIITYLYENTGNVEPSFSSKMYATLNADKPIWDQYVLKNLNLQLDGKGEERLQNAIALYTRIEAWYKDFIKTQNGKECIDAFDKALPSYSWISSTKKIDCFLWGMR